MNNARQQDGALVGVLTPVAVPPHLLATAREAFIRRTLEKAAFARLQLGSAVDGVRRGDTGNTALASIALDRFVAQARSLADVAGKGTGKKGRELRDWIYSAIGEVVGGFKASQAALAAGASPKHFFVGATIALDRASDAIDELRSHVETVDQNRRGSRSDDDRERPSPQAAELFRHPGLIGGHERYERDVPRGGMH